jgi:hypothetical protein
MTTLWIIVLLFTAVLTVFNWRDISVLKDLFNNRKRKG